MLIAARNAMMVSSNKEEEMYKELYESLVARTLDDAIGPDVTSIGAYAFYGNTGPVTIDFPNATGIGATFAQNNTRLVSVNLPKVTALNTGIFQGCSNLKTVILSAATSISSYMFYNCSSLELVDISSVGTGLTNLNTSNFYNCGVNAQTKTDAYGNQYKCLIKIGTPCANLVALFNFPSGAPTTTKFECPDGYVVYDTATSAWKAVATT